MFGMFPAVRGAGSPVKAPLPKPLLIPSGFAFVSLKFYFNLVCEPCSAALSATNAHVI